MRNGPEASLPTLDQIFVEVKRVAWVTLWTSPPRGAASLAVGPCFPSHLSRKGDHKMVKHGLALLLVLLFAAAFAQADSQTPAEIAQLLQELGSSADQDLIDNLNDPGLIPESGKHKAQLYWDTRTRVSARGSLAVPAPVAARVGHRLRAFRAQGVMFSDTTTVRRIFNATDSWDALIASPKFWDAIAEADGFIWKKAQQQGMTVPNATLIWAALEIRPGLHDMFVARESSRDVPIYTPTSDPGPDPGEMWCYQTYRAMTVPQGILCYSSGTDCWFRVPCPSGAGSPLPGTGGSGLTEIQMTTREW